MNLQEQYKKLFKGRASSNDKKLLSEAMAWERVPGKPLPTLKDVTEKFNKSVNEEQTITLRKLNARDMKQYKSYQWKDSRGKAINLATAVIGGIDRSQGADDGTSGAYLESLDYADGTPVQDQELENISDEHHNHIVELAVEFFHNAV